VGQSLWTRKQCALTVNKLIVLLNLVALFCDVSQMVQVVSHFAHLTVRVQHVHQYDVVASSACVFCLARLLPSTAYLAEQRPQAWLSITLPE